MQKIIETALQYGYQLSPGALTILATKENFDNLLRKAIKKTDQVIITKEVLNLINKTLKVPKEKNLNLTTRNITLPESSSPPLKSQIILKNSPPLKIEYFKEAAKDISAEIEIVNSFISTKGGEGIKGFYQLFKSRFDKLKKLIENRPDSHGTIPISSIIDVKEKETIKVVGIINRIHRTRKGGFFLNLEDKSGEGRCLIPSNVLKNDVLFLDTIILVTGYVKEHLFIATEIAQPDIPTTFKSAYADIPLFVALLSDLHVGSKTFLKNDFLNFLKFLKGKTLGFPKNINRLIPLIKYIIIAGDLVDGVGVYPKQEEDLIISDIRTQYEMVAKLLSDIPDHIEVILIPGNHDATRQALPQPPIDKNFVDAFDHLSNVHFLGNPSFIKLNGVRFLLSHGRPLDDTIPCVPGASFQNQKKALVKLLKARHLGPIYGAKTPFAPEATDSLVIENIPDVWHLGHTHVNEFVNYRGVKIINSGTFQTQTDWQRGLNINPTPGIVPFFNLQTHDIMHLSFL
ncbi:MAG: DNA-directed DNA polymerase II small subunit [Candidatus Heimdallarchaeota archaeon]